MENYIIEVRPLEKKRWHGKTQKEFPSAPMIVECYVNLENRRWETGLTEDDRNRLQKITGLDLHEHFIPDEEHPFYSTDNGHVKLDYDRTNYFDMRRPIDEIHVKMLMASPLVANSQSDWDEGKCPQAQFVIYDSREEVEKKAEKSKKRTQIYNLWSKMDTTTKKQVVQILLNQSMKNQSDDYIDSKMEDIMSTQGFDKVLEVFSQSKADNYMHSLIIDAVDKNIMQLRGGVYYYMDEAMGGIHDTMRFLQDVKNNAIKGQIIDKLNLK